MKPDEVLEAKFEAIIEDAMELSMGRELLVRIELLRDSVLSVDDGTNREELLLLLRALELKVVCCNELDRIEEATVLNKKLDKVLDEELDEELDDPDDTK
jgi:hypothetical protein